MCGILACLFSTDDSPAMRARVLALSRRQRHRGPDWSGLHQWENCFLAHERLAIIDPASGDQPLYNEDRSIVVAVNGEIYNYVALKAQIMAAHPDKKFRTESDCEVISHLYEDHGEKVASMLDGMFSFVLLDQNTNSFYAARDPIGITSLYIGWGRDGATWVASEMKCLKDECVRFQQFPPGHYYSSRTGEFTRYYNPQFYLDFEASPQRTPSAPYEPKVLREAFEAAVEKRMMSDVPFGVLLSGGLDSSLVASIAARKIARDGDSKWGKLHSFCIGLPGSPDLIAARGVAAFLGTDHHELTFTVQEGIDAVSDVIAHIETYDVTTIRASTPMFLMSRKIKALGVKMVLSGEGSDEVFGGYLYFHKAPNREEFFQETVRKVQALYQFDCLRANKSTMAWGVEARVPFLDRGFLDTAMAIDPAEKMIDKGAGRIEKYILRKAFDTPEKPYLPADVLWRQKEQFSDGVGYSWIDGLKAHADDVVSDAQLAAAQHRYPDNTPRTKEAYMYRTIFESHFPQKAAADTVPGGPSVACSTATAALWDAAWAGQEDPSGRAVAGVHDSAYAAKA
ncbi:MAG: asparagine synthase [Monoraphidium minutum]|nr:MAG: asparagine synthase [Monoraphidium minutum]